MREMPATSDNGPAIQRSSHGHRQQSFSHNTCTMGFWSFIHDLQPKALDVRDRSAITAGDGDTRQ